MPRCFRPEQLLASSTCEMAERSGAQIGQTGYDDLYDGVMIVGVMHSEPRRTCQIQKNDIIVAIDGQGVRDNLRL